MNKNKGDAVNIAGFIDLDNEPTKKNKEQPIDNYTPTRNKFQYYCSFCWRTLPTGSTRFNGFGACPRCYRLAHRFVDALRGHRANYFSNLGVRK